MIFMICSHDSKDPIEELSSELIDSFDSTYYVCITTEYSNRLSIRSTLVRSDRTGVHLPAPGLAYSSPDNILIDYMTNILNTTIRNLTRPFHHLLQRNPSTRLLPRPKPPLLLQLKTNNIHPFPCHPPTLLSRK